MTYFDSVQQAAGWIRERSVGVPDVAIVLGSGLGDFTATIGDQASFGYGDIPNWPASAVVGHAGRLVVGTLAGSVSRRSRDGPISTKATTCGR